MNARRPKQLRPLACLVEELCNGQERFLFLTSAEDSLTSAEDSLTSAEDSLTSAEDRGLHLDVEALVQGLQLPLIAIVSSLRGSPHTSSA